MWVVVSGRVGGDEGCLGRVGGERWWEGLEGKWWGEGRMDGEDG